MQWKRASPRGEKGTSRVLSVSDSDRRVPAELGQESQSSSCLRKGSPLDSRVAQGVAGPSSSCVWNPRVVADDAPGWQCPFVLCLHPQGCLRIGVRASGPSQERTGESGAPPVFLLVRLEIVSNILQIADIILENEKMCVNVLV